MKRLLCIVFVLLLLTGCGAEEPLETTTVPTETQTATQPPIPWIEAVGKPWDKDGVLTELPLDIPDALHYNGAMAFGCDLLLWSVDSHLENVHTLELCLVELDTGSVSVEKEIPFTQTVIPQILGDSLFLCDRFSGTILELDKKLEAVNSWTVEPREASFTMGGNEMLYIYDWVGNVSKLDLKTGQETPLLGEGAYMDYFNAMGEWASVEFYSDSGGKAMALLDLATGELRYPPLEKEFTAISYKNGTWLCDIYRDGYLAYVGTDSGEFLRAEIGFDSLQLLGDGKILRIREDGCTVSVHNPDGTSIAQAVITSEPYSYSPTILIPSEAFGGYFVLITDYSASMRLLHWNVEKSGPGEDIPLEPIPEPGQEEAAVRNRVRDLESTYGLNILLGEDTETLFYDFTGEQVTDWERIDDALDILEAALQNYPEGFFRQLRYDTIRSVDIHLLGTITATTEEYVHSYEGFVQYEYDRFTMGIDINMAGKQTYFHEFSHVIDSFLEWDSTQREDALFSESAWDALNPGWFPGYTWDYSREQYVEDYSCFIDSYSTIKPTEDRARVMEYAMTEFGGFFEEDTVLLEKLRYYCRCIRDAFDTTGWPETVLWEQYLDEMT